MAVPKKMQPIYDEVARIISEYCEEHLSEDYREICLRLLEKLCRKRPSPLLSGRKNTWAAGIVYAIASNNFIFDQSQPIHRTAEELSRPFGLSKSTVYNKAAEIRKMVDISPMDAQWLLPDLIDRNPAVWLVSLNGFAVDARILPREIQEIAFEKGLIPYVPASRQAEDDEE